MRAPQSSETDRVLHATIGILLLLLFVYRSPFPAVFSALPAASGLLAGITAVGLWFGTVHGITAGFAAILIGEAVDYPTYLYAQAGRGEALEATLGRIGATLRLAVLTTACGAMSMLLSSFNGLAQLGFLTIVGVFTAGLVTRWVLPALTPARILERKLTLPQFDLSPRAKRGTSAVWMAVAALCCVALFATARNERLWDDDLSNLTPIPEELKALDRNLRSQLGAPDPRHLIVVTGSDRESVLRAASGSRVLDKMIVAGGMADTRWRRASCRVHGPSRSAVLRCRCRNSRCEPRTRHDGLAVRSAHLPFWPTLSRTQRAGDDGRCVYRDRLDASIRFVFWCWRLGRAGPYFSARDPPRWPRHCARTAKPAYDCST
jgi:hypothetical protein